MPQKLVMSPQDTAKVLTRLASTDVPGSQDLYARIMGSWGNRPDRAYITFRPTPSERLVLRRIPLPARVVSSSPRYVAVYRCDNKPDVEVILRTQDVPSRKRKLKVAGGVRKFTLIKLYQTKESITMAKTKAAKGTKGKTKAADPVDELEAELEGLEEVDIEDEDEDEPEVEDTEEEEEDEDEDEEDDDEDVDYNAMKNADLKALCKERGIKGVDKANKAKLVEMLEANDAEDDEEDDEEEDDGLDEMDRAALKARMAELDLGKAKKSQSEDDLRALIREASEDEEEEDEEEDDEEEEEEDEDDGYDEMDRSALKKVLADLDLAKAKKSESDDDLRTRIRSSMEGAPKTAPAKRSSGKGKSQPRQLVRELPKGKLGANDIAEMAGTKALNVRNFLRNNKTKFPKDEALGRYAFTAKQAQAIVAAMKKGGVQTTKGGTKKGGKRK